MTTRTSKWFWCGRYYWFVSGWWFWRKISRSSDGRGKPNSAVKINIAVVDGALAEESVRALSDVSYRFASAGTTEVTAFTGEIDERFEFRSETVLDVFYSQFRFGTNGALANGNVREMGKFAAGFGGDIALSSL